MRRAKAINGPGRDASQGPLIIAKRVACRAVARGNSPPSPDGLRRGSLPRFASEGWWACLDSNQEPDRYERPALTIELQAPPRLPPCWAGNGATDPLQCGRPWGNGGFRRRGINFGFSEIGLDGGVDAGISRFASRLAQRGVSRSSRTLGAGCGGRFDATDERI